MKSKFFSSCFLFLSYSYLSHCQGTLLRLSDPTAYLLSLSFSFHFFLYFFILLFLLLSLFIPKLICDLLILLVLFRLPFLAECFGIPTYLFLIFFFFFFLTSFLTSINNKYIFSSLLSFSSFFFLHLNPLITVFYYL